MTPSIPKQLIIQAILILINAFFAATEIAVISLNHNKIRKQAEEGDQKSAKLVYMVENPSSFLSTIQIGITLAGFLGSALAADTLSDRLTAVFVGWGIPFSTGVLDAISVVVITVIISFFTLIFGELVPKRLAQQKSEQIARFAVTVLGVLSKIMKPFIWILSKCTNGVLRLCRLNPNDTEEEVTEDDIRLMIDAGGESGNIEEDEQEWIQNVFEFNDTAVSEVMVRNNDIVAIQEKDHNAEILRTIKESGRSRIPVYGEDLDDIKGILNTRDFLLNLNEEHMKKLSDLLRPAYFVPETIHADKLFADMQSKKQHMAICVDEYGQTSGIITLEDLLEEIVGNIYDEFDEAEEEEIQKVGENRWKVSGTLSVEDLEDELELGLNVEDLEYDTVGGMVFSCLNEIPQDGTEFDVETNGMKIHVSKVEDRRIVECIVTKEEKPEETEAGEEEKEGFLSQITKKKKAEHEEEDEEKK